MEKNNTIRAFFALLQGGLWESEVHLLSFSKVDFEEVMRQADKQAVVGLVSAGLINVQDVKVPKVVLLNFLGKSLQLEHHNSEMNLFVGALVENMRIAGINTLLVKGQGLAKCYERPLWRSCGDIDLFLCNDNYNKAKEFIVPLSSYVEPEEKYKQHLGMIVDGWNVELHGNLKGGISGRIDKELDEIYRDTFNNGTVSTCELAGTQVFLLGIENNVIYIFTHILQHFYKGGVGLRQVCDWCRFIWANKEYLRIEFVEKRVRKMGLVSEWKAFAALTVDYLGMSCEIMPLYSNEKRWHRKADKICCFIMEVGNFGHNRDMGYYFKKPYVVRKVVSLGHRIGDLFRHTRIFPIDSIRFFPRIVYNGLISATKGE